MQKDNRLYYTNILEEDLNYLNQVLSKNDQVSTKHITDQEELIRLLKKQVIEFLIVKYDDNTKNFFNFVKTNPGYFIKINLLILIPEDRQKDLIILQPINENFQSVVLLNLNAKIVELASVISDFINITNEIDPETPIYVPINYNMFLNVKTSPCDIFIKLSDKKFVKIISINGLEDPFEVIKKYIAKGAKEIYVLTKDLNKIKSNIAKEIFKIDTSKSIEKQKLQIADSVMAIAKDFGVSDFMINGINDTFKELSEDFNKDNKFENLLTLIKKNEGTVLGNHSYLTAIFSVMIASKTNWATSNIRKNLTTAAILHDLELIDSPNFRYEFKSIEEINELPTQMCNEFKSHPTKLATQLAKNNSIPTDVINLIAKHHEGSSREKSYPMGILSSQLTPPNCVFNVAHHFSMELAALGFNFTKGKVALQKTREFFEGSAMIQTFIDLLEKELVL